MNMQFRCFRAIRELICIYLMCLKKCTLKRYTHTVLRSYRTFIDTYGGRQQAQGGEDAGVSLCTNPKYSHVFECLNIMAVSIGHGTGGYRKDTDMECIEIDTIIIL